MLEGGFLNVFGVSETWLKESVSDGVVGIPGYVCHRNDRLSMRGGGVALYISKGVKNRLVYKSCNYGVVECLFVELCYGDVKLLVGVVYLPRGDFGSFECEVSDLLIKYSNIVILGDFNNNLFDPSKSLVVRDVCNRMGLTLVHNSIPTHFDIRYNSTSLLDFFLVSLPELVVKSGQFQCPGITRHSFIFISLKASRLVPQQFYQYYDYKAVTVSSFEEMLTECSFDNMYLTSSVDEQLMILNENLQFLHSAVPLRRRILKTQFESWINAPEIKYQASLRDLAYREYLRNRTDVNWRIFCRHRNRVKTVIRRFKRSAHCLLFENKDSREIWSILNRNGVGCSVENLKDIDPNELNNAFSANQSLNAVCDVDVPSVRLNGFSFRSVDIFEMFAAFDLIKSKAVGSDGFTLSFLKILMPIVGNYVLHLVNTILTTSTFPSLWKIAKIVPIKKSSGVFGVDDFRPISILPILSKMVEHLIKIQLVRHIDSNNFLHDCQSGFRCNRSTTSLLIGLTDRIRENISNSGVCVMLSLDLAKAFDRVNHALLVKKLYTFYGFSNSACKLITSYLSDRKQFVVCSGSSSSLLPVYSGVPQGSVLGPLLFILFINDLFGVLSSNVCLPFSFADDVQLLFMGDSVFPDVLQNVIDYSVGLLSKWVSDNGLALNASKTKAMLFGNRVENLFSIVLNDVVIEFVDKIKCLGLIIDKDLRFESHINSVVAKVSFTMRKLYSLDLILPFHVKKQVVHGLIMPIFLYALEVYSGSLGYVFKKIRLAFNRVVRYLYSLRIRQHVSSYVIDFLGMSFMDFVRFRLLMHFYKSLKLQVPMYLVDLFKFGRSNRNRQLRIPTLTSILERSFNVRVARDYNKLPAMLREFDYSIDAYRRKLRCVLMSE